MKQKLILVAGGTGLIGQSLCSVLLKNGHKVRILSRSERDSTNIEYFQWDPAEGYIDEEALDQVDVIYNLAGAGIADKRWTSNRKDIIIKSRIQSTETIATALAKRQQKIDHYISASAIGYYGDSGDKLMTENDGPEAVDFLSKCCALWEDAANLLQNFSEHHSILRIGVVMDAHEGALPQLLMPFKFGTAAYMGSGKQIYSWIHVQDVVGILNHLLEQKLDGTYNGVAPQPVSMKKLIQTAKKVLDSKAMVVGIPAFMLKLGLGDMSKVVLNSNRVSNNKIDNTNYDYKFPNLEAALTNLLKE